MPDFYFWNVGATKSNSSRTVQSIFQRNVHDLSFYILKRERKKNRNISIKCHNWTYFYYWDLKVYECQCDLMWTNLHSSLNEQLINSDEMLFFPETLLKNHWNELKINEKSDINAVSVCCSTTALTECLSENLSSKKVSDVICLEGRTRCKIPAFASNWGAMTRSVCHWRF